ncbi:hypothetical protein FACS1894125_6400 [Actinomycetota bacterium]|nr:hypothetical protein FACS1894125_6400 [Actinomycetota bacterium]
MKTINRNGVIAKLVSGLFAVSLVVVLSVGLSSCGESGTDDIAGEVNAIQTDLGTDPIVGTWQDSSSSVTFIITADGSVSANFEGYPPTSWSKNGDEYVLKTDTALEWVAKLAQSNELQFGTRTGNGSLTLYRTISTGNSDNIDMNNGSMRLSDSDYASVYKSIYLMHSMQSNVSDDFNCDSSNQSIIRTNVYKYDSEIRELCEKLDASIKEMDSERSQAGVEYSYNELNANGPNSKSAFKLCAKMKSCIEHYNLAGELYYNPKFDKEGKNTENFEKARAGKLFDDDLAKAK